MIEIQDFWLFVAASVILNLTPGQDTFYILGRSLAQGRLAGLVSALGISSGVLVHTLAAAAGLSAILANSAVAFSLIKALGAVYLIGLGGRMLFWPQQTLAVGESFDSLALRRVYFQGLLTNVLNPKVALFFLAFMPQFIRAEAESQFLAFLILGLCFVATGTLWVVSLAWFAASFRDRFAGSPRATRRLNQLAGGVFVGLGLRLAGSK